MSAISTFAPTGLIPWLILAWVRVYTAGLPKAIRARRLSEILSDLWEHDVDRSEQGANTFVIRLEALNRAGRGAAADLFWRFNLEGEPRMVSKSLVTRSAGLVLITIVGLLAGTAGLDYGISGDEPYFSEDFPAFAADVSNYGLTLAAAGLLAVACILGAGVLLQAFRVYQVWLAILGSAALLVAGLLMVGSVTAGGALIDLAEEWTARGSDTNDGVFVSARYVAQIHEDMAFLALMFIIASLASFAALVIWKGPVPRWVGGIGIVSGAIALASIPAWALDDGLGWLAFMVSTGAGVLWLALTGGWLFFKGAYVRPQAVAVAE